MSCHNKPKYKASKDYEKRTEDPQGEDPHDTTFVFVTPRKWDQSWEWVEEREGKPWVRVRVLDVDDLVAWLREAPKVARQFASRIGKPIGVNWDESSVHVDGIQKRLRALETSQIETRSDLGSRISELPAKLASVVGSQLTPAEPGDPASFADPAHRALAEKIDFARDLINTGLVRSARDELEQLKNQDAAIPEELQFRILTNLGACALAEEDFDSARSFLEDAHRLQPDNVKAIANAALAAILGKNYEQAIVLALKARTLDPQDSQATAVLMEVYFEKCKDDLLEELVASEEWVARDKQCRLTLARIRMRQSRFEESATLCRSLINDDRKDPIAQLTLSEILLNHSDSERLAIGLTGESLSRLRGAKDAATAAIDLLSPHKLEAQRRRALVTRAVIRKFLGATSQAIGDLDEVLAAVPWHPDAAFHKGLLLLREGLPEDARSVFECIQDTRRRADAVLPLSEACLASGDPAAAVRLLKGTVNLECPRWHDVSRAEVLCLAEIAVGDEDSLGPALENALERHPPNARLLTIAALRRKHSDNSKAAESLLLKALDYAGYPDRLEILAQLGGLYEKLNRFAEAADRFAEVVDGAVSNPHAIRLLACLVNGRRLRKALSWARTIRKGHPQPPKLVIETEARLLEYVGDIRAAVSIHEEICSRADGTTVDRVNLALAQFRCGHRESAIQTVNSIDVSALRHEPRSILALAQLKLILGVPGSLDDVYYARRARMNDPAVHQGYLQQFQSSDGDMETPTVVGPGCAVLLKGDTGEQWWQILEDGEEPSGSHELKPNDDLAQRLIGCRLGDTIVLRAGVEDLSYDVSDLQNKFVRAFQETFNEFSTRFPDNVELSRIPIDDKDLSNIRRLVDKRDDFTREVNRLYQEGRLPILSFSALIGQSGLEVWRQYTRAGGTRIRFGTGSEEETTKATAIIRESDGVVLDLVAVLTAYELGIAGQLKSRFARVAVPQFVIDEIQKVAVALKSMGPVSGYLGKSNYGEYTLTEPPERDWKEQQDFVNSVLEFADSFERIASYPLLDADQAEKIVDTLTEAGAGGVYASDEQSPTRLVLVSDDLCLSDYARSLGRGAVNTQAVLEELLRTNDITVDAYSSYVEQLASLNYWFVRVSSQDIISRLEANGYMTNEGTRAMLRTLEGPDCSDEAAVSVASELISTLAGRAPLTQTQLILSVVIAELRRGRELRPVLQMLKDEIATRLALVPFKRDQLLLTVDLHMWI